MTTKHVIIGNGIAGVTAAATLAAETLNDEIHLYTDEQYPYYRRPWLPDLLAGNYEIEDLHPYAPEWYDARRIQVHLGNGARSIDLATRTVRLESGDEVVYDRLLLACGGNSWIPPVANSSLPGVFTLKTVADALAIRKHAETCESAIVVGGGLLGLEAARGLKALGLKVTVIEIFPYLLPRQLDAEGAAVLTHLIEAMGIKVITGVVAETVIGETKAEGVRLKNGLSFTADLIHFSAGIRPNLNLAAQAGIAVHRGVIANEYMQTSDPNVFTAGDVAEFKERVYGIIPAAIEQARVAAANMLSAGSASYQGTVPINTLKVVGIDLTAVGTVNPEGEGYVIHRSARIQDGLYKKLVFENGALIGAILLGDRKNVIPVTRLVNRRAEIGPLGPKLLADNFDWKSLL